MHGSAAGQTAGGLCAIHGWRISVSAVIGSRSGREAAGVPGVNLAHMIGIGRVVRAQGGADVAHEGDGRAGWGPDSQHPGNGAVRVAEGVPLPAGGDEHGPGGCFLRLIVSGYQQAAAQRIDRLIERVVCVRDGPGEMSRDGELHGREPCGPVPGSSAASAWWRPSTVPSPRCTGSSPPRPKQACGAACTTRPAGIRSSKTS